MTTHQLQYFINPSIGVDMLKFVTRSLLFILQLFYLSRLDELNLEWRGVETALGCCGRTVEMLRRGCAEACTYIPMHAIIVNYTMKRNTRGDELRRESRINTNNALTNNSEEQTTNPRWCTFDTTLKNKRYPTPWVGALHQHLILQHTILHI